MTKDDPAVPLGGSPGGSDRELLELAAKAAGYKVAWEGGCMTGWMAGGAWWNPFTDDGDRYRLARDLRLVLDFDGGEVRWYPPGETVPRAFRWMPGGNVDIEARAIVRAAAALAPPPSPLAPGTNEMNSLTSQSEQPTTRSQP